jgi:hypothetical protein
MKLTNKNNNFIQGIFKPTHPEKYKGHDFPRYLSSWELKLFRWCDMNPNVLEWGSESIVITYNSPIDNRSHRYIVDAIIKLNTSNGVKKYLVEVKPFKQTIKPVASPNKKSKSLLYEQLTFIQNQAKWASARKWCKERGYEFIVLTERELKK